MQTARAGAHIKRHIPAFFTFCICFGASGLISARGSVQCACVNAKSVSLGASCLAAPAERPV